MKKVVSTLMVMGLAASALIACERSILGADGRPIVGTTGGGGSSGQTSGAQTATATAVTGVGSGPASNPTAVALMAAELPPNSMACGFMPCAMPSDKLFIAISSLGNTCQDPLGAQSSTVNWWQHIIGLPAKDQVVGTYSLMDPDITSEGEGGIHGASGPSGVTTAAGLGGTGEGTIEVVSIDKTQVTVKLTGTGLNWPEDGEYVATRCTPLP